METRSSSHRPSFLSTGVVSAALGLTPDHLRAQIEIGLLPEPQWMSLGSRIERVYSLEWLILANEQINLQRLPGMESELDSSEAVQFALRFDQEMWTLEQLAQKFGALNSLWNACVEMLDTDGTAGAAPLNVRRISAGSPLDILAWVSQNWTGLLGAGGIATVFTFVLKHPSKVSEAIPRAIAGWWDQWGKVHDARVAHLESKVRRRQFELKAGELLRELDAVPTDLSLNGTGTSRLELIAPPSQSGLSATSFSPEPVPNDADRDSVAPSG